MSAQPATPFRFGDLPEGTVTFLFSDIEGSTQLLYRLGDQFKAVLAEHHRILREAVAHGGGQVVRTEGDSFFVAFPRATGALAAAVEALRALVEHPWPEGAPIRVRMGLHTGEPEVALDDYVGIAIHRAARIAHVGHGGQVLLSETTTALVQDDLPPGVSLLDLGRHLLKDIRRPERICQLAIEGLPAELPPLKTLGMLPPEGARLPRPVGGCPYRGLAAFREADAAFYCGREAFVDQLEQAVRHQVLTAVIVGSSGSGKSSALFAGLLPRLRKGDGWQFALMRPGSQPFYALAGALLPLLETGLSETDRLTETRKLADRLANSEVRLAQAGERICERSPQNRQVLLVVDQFEELYTLCADPRVQQAFIDELLAAADAGKVRRPAPCVILLTLRADFMGQALAYRPFADALQAGSLLMGPMTRQELRAAIEKPAEMQGAAFEAGLVERILDDVGDKPGNLPLLEFTLTLLWDRQTDGWLTHSDYEAMGNVEGGLATYADRVYSDLEPGEQECARRALVQLVRPGEGTEDTRRVATREELGEGNWKLIQHLADRRLVVTGRDDAGHETAEVVHEALIQRWGRFREWMVADRAFRAWQERLRAAQHGWEAAGRDEGALLRGAPLVEAEGWLAERAGELSQAERDFVAAGAELRERDAAEREAQRQREMEAARQLAAERARAAGRLRRRAAWLGLALIVALAAVALAAGLWNRSANLAAEKAAAANAAQAASTQSVKEAAAARTAQALEAGQRGTAEAAGAEAVAEAGARATQEAVAKAEAQARATQQAIAEAQTGLATSRELAASALNATGQNPELGVLLALEAVKAAGTIEAENALHSTLPALHLMHTWPGTGLCSGPNVTGDLRRVAMINPEGGVTIWQLPASPLWQADEMQPVATLTPPWPVTACRLGPDGVRLYIERTDAGSYAGEVWDVPAQRLLFAVPSDADPAPCFGNASPDMRLVVTLPCGQEASTTVSLWDVASGSKVWELDTGHEPTRSTWQPSWYGIYWFEFSADGGRLVTTGIDRTVRVFDTATGQAQYLLAGHTDEVIAAEFSPDGQRLATAGRDNTARIWDLAPGPTAGKEIVRIERDSEVVSVGFSPDGEVLATGALGEGVELWDAADGAQILSLKAGQAGSLVFSSDGTRLFSCCASSLWDLSPDHEVLTLQAPVAMPIFGPDGRVLAAGTGDGRALLWDARSGELLHTLAGHSDLTFLAFSPDGSRLAATSWDNKGEIWDARSGARLVTLPDYGQALWSPAFSPDGSKLAAGLGNGAIKVWDATTGLELLTLTGHTECPYGVAWSPDGRRLASGSRDDTVRLWDAESGQLLATLPRDGDAYGVAFSPDGSRLATADAEWTVTIWDVTSLPPHEMRILEGHTQGVLAVAWSPDGTQLASGSFDGTVRLWDAASGQEQLNLALHTNGVLAVSFSPDGSRLVSGGWDGTVRVYALKLDELVALAKKRLTRTLTDEECRRYLHLEACPADQ